MNAKFPKLLAFSGVLLGSIAGQIEHTGLQVADTTAEYAEELSSSIAEVKTRKDELSEQLEGEADNGYTSGEAGTDLTEDSAPGIDPADIPDGSERYVDIDDSAGTDSALVPNEPEPESTPESEPSAEPESEPSVESEAEASAESEAEELAEPQTEPDSETQPGLDSPAEQEPEVEGSAEPGAEASAEPQPEAEPEAEQHATPEPEPDDPEPEW